MIDFLNSFKSLIKLDQIHTDTYVFKLHYKFTVILLIVFSILLTSKQYFGDPIKCESRSRAVPESVLESFCWVFGTHTLATTLDMSNQLSGLGNYPEKFDGEVADGIVNNLHNNEDIVVQKYYQWVCLVFCMQALMFYVPRHLWKTWEGGRMRLLVNDLGGPLISDNWNVSNKERLLNYFLSGHYSHNCYAIRFLFCEFLNLINVVGQIFLMDWFLMGEFTGYGIALATFNKYNRHEVNPMTRVFPKLTKCSYRNYGPSGSIQKIDALCVLPLNVVNEKLFIFLWFWLFTLSLLSILELFYRILVLSSKTVRMYELMIHVNSLSRKDAYAVVSKMSFGDVFLLGLVLKNINDIMFKDLLSGLAQLLKGHPDSKKKQHLQSRSFELETTMIV